MNSQTVNIRVNKKTKEQAQAIFKKLGLSFSTAVSLYLEQVIMKNGIPFALDLSGVSNSSISETIEKKASSKQTKKRGASKSKKGGNVNKAFSELFD